eukprot:6983209-Pyramimonas_sp.AAC.1
MGDGGPHALGACAPRAACPRMGMQDNGQCRCQQSALAVSMSGGAEATRLRVRSLDISLVQRAVAV